VITKLATPRADWHRMLRGGIHAKPEFALSEPRFARSCTQTVVCALSRTNALPGEPSKRTLRALSTFFPESA
jgi:hypothetical protein